MAFEDDEYREEAASILDLYGVRRYDMQVKLRRIR